MADLIAMIVGSALLSIGVALLLSPAAALVVLGLLMILMALTPWPIGGKR